MAFAEATRPRPRRILRVPLLPYSIGHELILQQRKNPLLYEGFPLIPEKEQHIAIIEAVLICSRTWEQNSKPERGLKIWLWLIRKDNFKKAAIEFMQYRADGSSCPRIAPPDREDDGRALGAPFHCRVLAYAAPIFGKAVFDKALGMLQWMYFAWAESEGQCRIENDFERQVREETEQIQSDYDREQREKKEAQG